MDIQKPIRDYLRAADIIIDYLRRDTMLSAQEFGMLQAYNMRITALCSAKQLGADATQEDGRGRGEA